MKVVNADAQTRRECNPSESESEEKRGGSRDEISLDDAFCVLDRDKRSKRVVLDIVAAVMHLALLLAMLFTHFPVTSVLYSLGDSVSSTLASTGGDTITADSPVRFANIQTIGDTFEWLTDSFVPSVFVTMDYNDKLLAKDKWGRVAMFNKVLGGVVFNTTRAQIHPCNAEQFLVDLYPNCYNAADVVTESVLISFDTNASEATDVIRRLKVRGDWLDFATQSLDITVVMYNGEIQAYVVTELTVAFHQDGSVEPSYKTTALLADPYKSSIVLVFDILMALSFVAMLAQVVFTEADIEAYERRARYLERRDARPRSAAWIITELLAVQLPSMPIAEVYCFLYVVLHYLLWNIIVKQMADESFHDNLARLVVSGKKFDVNSAERNGLLAVTDALSNTASFTLPLRIISVLAIVAAAARVMRAFHKHPRLGVLTRTIGIALGHFRGVGVVFIVVFVTFSSIGAIVFGSHVEGFSSLGASLETCINMLFGSFDYATIQDGTSPVWLFYWSYMVLVSLVLLNIMLAIVVDAYAEVSATKSEQQSDTSLVRVATSVHEDALDLVHRLATNGVVLRSSPARAELGKIFRLRHPHGSRARVLELCRALAPHEVVVRNRIRPSLLHLVLRSLRENRRSASEGPVTKQAEPLAVSAASLKDWFAGAQVDDAVARATMEYLRELLSDGETTEEACAESGGIKGEHSGAQDIDKGSEATEVASREAVVATLSDTSVADTDDVSAAVPASDQEETRAGERATTPMRGAMAQPAARDETAASDTAAQVALLAQHIAALERKLDALLQKLPTE